MNRIIAVCLMVIGLLPVTVQMGGTSLPQALLQDQMRLYITLQLRHLVGTETGVEQNRFRLVGLVLQQIRRWGQFGRQAPGACGGGQIDAERDRQGKMLPQELA